MLPWIYFLDHVHYARWLSIYLHDLEQVEVKNLKNHQRTKIRLRL